MNQQAASATPRSFVISKSYGDCTVCKQEMRRGTLVKRVKLTGYHGANVYGFAHAKASECKRG